MEPSVVLSAVAASFALMLVAAGLYHWVFLKGAREGWPIIGSLVRLVVKDEFAQRDRFMRENIEVMASHVGIGLNPSAWWAVADRLAQPEGQWKPFERKRGLHGLLFPDPHR